MLSCVHLDAPFRRSIQTLHSDAPTHRTIVTVLVLVLTFFNNRGVLVAKHGVQSLETSLNGINPGLFCQLLQQVWVTKAKAVTNPFLRKALCVAGSRMLAESNALKQQPHVWAQGEC